MHARFLLSTLLVLSLVGASTAQLSGDYTIDPAGSGSRNFTTFAAASTALGSGISAAVKFDVASTMPFNEAVVLNPVTGATATFRVTFVATGSPAVINAGGAVGLTLQGGSKYYDFVNLKITGATTDGIYMAYSSPNRVEFCTFKNVEVVMPATSSTGVNALDQQQARDITYEDCKFVGGGRGIYTQGAYRCNWKRCEFDGLKLATQVVNLWNANDSDCLIENSFVHDCGPSGYGIHLNYSGYGVMLWHNTIIVDTSRQGVLLGGCCAWSRANSFRNNIVINNGTGSCIMIGHSGGLLDYNDADFNCYYAPNGSEIALEGGTTFTTGTVAQWQTFYTANRTTLVRTGGPTPAQAMMEDNSIGMDPALVSAAGPLYNIHLKAGSPCVDAGTTTYVAGSWISYNQTYLVADDFEGEIRPATLVDIGADEAASRMLTFSGTGKINSTVNLTLDAGTGDANRPYQLASAFADTPPIPIDRRLLNLSFDPLFYISVIGVLPTIFSNYAGNLDASGQAKAAINIPNIPALDQIRIYTAFVTIDANAPSNIKSISNTVMFTILK